MRGSRPADAPAFCRNAAMSEPYTLLSRTSETARCAVMHARWLAADGEPHGPAVDVSPAPLLGGPAATDPRDGIRTAGVAAVTGIVAGKAGARAVVTAVCVPACSGLPVAVGEIATITVLESLSDGMPTEAACESASVCGDCMPRCWTSARSRASALSATASCGLRLHAASAPEALTPTDMRRAPISAARCGAAARSVTAPTRGRSVPLPHRQQDDGPPVEYKGGACSCAPLVFE